MRVILGSRRVLLGSRWVFLGFSWGLLGQNPTPVVGDISGSLGFSWALLGSCFCVTLRAARARSAQSGRCLILLGFIGISGVLLGSLGFS